MASGARARDNLPPAPPALRAARGTHTYAHRSMRTHAKTHMHARTCMHAQSCARRAPRARAPRPPSLWALCAPRPPRRPRQPFAPRARARMRPPSNAPSCHRTHIKSERPLVTPPPMSGERETPQVADVRRATPLASKPKTSRTRTRRMAPQGRSSLPKAGDSCAARRQESDGGVSKSTFENSEIGAQKDAITSERKPGGVVGRANIRVWRCPKRAPLRPPSGCVR